MINANIHTLTHTHTQLRISTAHKMSKFAIASYICMHLYAICWPNERNCASHNSPFRRIQNSVSCIYYYMYKMYTIYACIHCLVCDATCVFYTRPNRAIAILYLYDIDIYIFVYLHCCLLRFAVAHLDRSTFFSLLLLLLLTSGHWFIFVSCFFICCCFFSIYSFGPFINV